MEGKRRDAVYCSESCVGKAARARRDAAGLCVNCGARRCKSNVTICAACYARSRDQVARLKVEGKCYKCGGHTDLPHARCSRCRDAESAKQRLVRTGWVAERFAEACATQRNRCAICGREMCTGRDRHADHCHRTGKPRAVLCKRCNTALGSLRDSPYICRAAAHYLERWAAEHKRQELEEKAATKRKPDEAA